MSIISLLLLKTSPYNLDDLNNITNNMVRFIKLVVWILIISGGIFFWQYSSFENTILTEKETTLEVTGGGFQSTLIDAWANPVFTKLYLKENTPDFNLQKGRYIIPANADVKTYLESLKNPLNETDIQLTFLEGWNIFDIDEFLVNKNLIKTWEFISYATNAENIRLLKQDDSQKTYPFLMFAQSLEGFLYPDTYAINPNNFTVENLARRMLDRFDEKVFTAYKKTENNINYKSFLDDIIMASIVEKEERNPLERPTVAGILKKRLDENWMIGADITVCYAHKLTSEQCKLSVTKYLYDKNDYNTRQKVGLPTWPIGNPSYSSIKAVLESKESPYYYYLHDTVTGKIYYGRTEAEHNRNKQLYLR